MRRRTGPGSCLRLGAGLLAILLSLPATADPAKTVSLGYLALAVKRSLPLSYLDQPPADEGVQGARLALADDQTTGGFLQQKYELDEVIAPDADAVVAGFKELVAKGTRLIATDLPADLLLRLADLPEAKQALLLDATSIDDALRQESCRRNVMHFLPDRAMRADALMQFLTVKNWRHILLVTGQEDADKLDAEALRRSAKKFQIGIVADKPWTFVAGARRTDTGHFQIEAEVARFTQGLSYDVLVAADEADNFGDDLAYRTTDPRPVAGSEGLTPTSWARPFEQWGATQLQNRFLRQAGRWMTERDFGAWMAVRAAGEAASRAGSTDPAALIAYIEGPDFDMAAFKGASLSFRKWDGQLRQPVLLADAHSLVSVSPQPGFLHQFSELDTLGIDEPETKCHF
jgi:ABC transporter substrate binding protein (PQQ-dependent alcohol dehydrogenase system)